MAEEKPDWPALQRLVDEALEGGISGMSLEEIWNEAKGWTAQDRAQFVAALDKPPAPTEAAKKAASSYRARVVHTD